MIYRSFQNHSTKQLLIRPSNRSASKYNIILSCYCYFCFKFIVLICKMQSGYLINIFKLNRMCNVRRHDSIIVFLSHGIETRVSKYGRKWWKQLWKNLRAKSESRQQSMSLETKNVTAKKKKTKKQHLLGIERFRLMDQFIKMDRRKPELTFSYVNIKLIIKNEHEQFIWLQIDKIPHWNIFNKNKLTHCT